MNTYEATLDEIFKPEKVIKSLTTELKLVLDNAFHYLKEKKILILINPHYCAQDGVNEEKAIKWSREACPLLIRHLINEEHKIDGKDWSVGSFGSRWKDMKLAGQYVRICFYSKKHNGDTIYNGSPDDCEPYMMMFDPHDYIN
tara:strand:- start:818 stop:1246 length:429 start_codon:yes stop_codon:yes gene_type:complete